MTAYDLYVISPYLAMAGAALLVILLDLAMPREGLRAKGMLGYAAVALLIVPFVLTLIQFYDLRDAGEFMLVDDHRDSPPLFWWIPAVSLVGPESILHGSLSVDRFALYFNFLVLAAAALVALSSTGYLRQQARSAGAGGGRWLALQGEYYGLLLFSASGMMLLAAATELITIYVALELTTLPLAALAAFMLHARSAEAGVKFLLLGAISSAVMLYGMALVFGFTGSTQLAEISQSVGLAGGTSQWFDPQFGNYALLLGVVLLVAGFGFKISAAPFQMWVPDVYEGAPTPVVAFLSVASKAAGFAILLRVFYTGFFDTALDWAALLAVLAAASMVIGNAIAMVQSNIRRLFGYSAIAHAGYLLVGVAAGVKGGGIGPEYMPIGPDSVVFYLAAYTAANLTGFFAIAAISARVGSDRISDYAGLFSRSPLLAVGLAFALIALIGVPPTGIFIGKLYLFTAAVDSGLAWLAILGVVNSAVSAYYYARIIRVMFLRPAAAPRPAAPDRSPAPWVALGVAAAATLFMGIAPGFIMQAARSAVAALGV